MNRLVLMVLRNFWRVPGAYGKLCYYAKHTEKYSEEVKYRHIQYILKLAVKSGNIDLKVYGKENIPMEDGFLTNHAKNSPTSIGGERNWNKKLSLDNKKKIEYT